MDWLSLQIDQLEPSFIRPHPVALVAALAFGLFWLRAGPRVLPGRPGAWFGLVIGAAAYVPVLLWVQGEPTRAALAIIRDNVGPGELAGARPLVGVVEALIAGYAAEIVKLLLMLLVLFAMGYPRDSAAATTAGLAPAAGFALFGAQLELTRAFEGAPVAGVLAFPGHRASGMGGSEFRRGVPAGDGMEDRAIGNLRHLRGSAPCRRRVHDRAGRYRLAPGGGDAASGGDRAAHFHRRRQHDRLATLGGRAWAIHGEAHGPVRPWPHAFPVRRGGGWMAPSRCAGTLTRRCDQACLLPAGVERTPGSIRR